MTDHLRDKLRLEDILVLAERQSGARIIANEGLRERVAAMTAWINERGPYSPDQVRRMCGQLSHLLANRLKISLDRERYPQIANETIDRPIFIIGLPRSGTTLLHSLLAEDPEVFAPRSWHLYSPSPPPGAGPVAAERIGYAQRQVEAWMDMCPGQKSMHPYIDKGAHQLCEDEEIFALDYRIAYPYQFSAVPTLEEMPALDPDLRGAYGFHRELLQHLQWRTGRNRWTCKIVGIRGNVDAIFAAYPDALCVWPHRSMVDIFASIITLAMATYDAIAGRPGDWSGKARMVAERMKAGLDTAMAGTMLDDPRVLHMRFEDIAADPLGAVRTIYEHQGRVVSPEFERRSAVWLADPENAVDRHGRYAYSYETLGLDRRWVEDLFADYSKWFNLTPAAADR